MQLGPMRLPEGPRGLAGRLGRGKTSSDSHGTVRREKGGALAWTILLKGPQVPCELGGFNQVQELVK